jgi:hypothetical protein
VPSIRLLRTTIQLPGGYLERNIQGSLGGWVVRTYKEFRTVLVTPLQLLTGCSAGDSFVSWPD